jgi:hypothetical protein
LIYCHSDQHLSSAIPKLEMGMRKPLAHLDDVALLCFRGINGRKAILFNAHCITSPSKISRLA